jgi:hypothetical protein
MNLSFYDSFASMIDILPARAITRALERQRCMLEEDLALQRPVSLDEAESVLNFCHFVEAVRDGLPGWAFTSPPPPDHLEFYRKTLDRLIASEELPFTARAKFDDIIADCCLRPLPCAG